MSAARTITVTRAAQRLGRLPELLAHLAALTVVALVLVSAGQPLFAEDTWWHLAMGEAYAASGPWLDADPLLFTATGPPAPAAWLSDLGLHALERTVGLQGLRVFHVLLVAGILGLAWSALRRASGSPVFASLGTSLFAALSAYRLFQLRPHLATLLGALLLFRWLLEDAGPPSRRRLLAAVVGMGIWANLHAGFLLGPVLVAAALAGLAAGVIAAALRVELRDRAWQRAGGLALALGLGLLATLANPTGARQHLLYFAAGEETPALGLVTDEWAPLDLLHWPLPNLPPSPLAWSIVWLLLLATPLAVALHARRQRRERSCDRVVPIDPALVAIAAVSLVALVSAVRFLWMGIFPLLLLGQSARALGVFRDRFHGIACAVPALLLVPGFVWQGDWPMISNAIHPAWYGRPYPAFKHHAHAVWLLRDAELEGNLFNDYSSGNFLGYWLAPRMRTFVNGSLNVPWDVMDARHAIVTRQAPEPGESFTEMLDRYRIDAFFGTGLPRVSRPTRPSISTTTHLERSADWIQVFRNVRSAIYLRDNPRNRMNLQRLTEFYQREQVPFDPQRGFDPARVLREAPLWAFEHGLIPAGFEQLEKASLSRDPTRRVNARHRLAALYATLGLYESAVEIDRRLLRADPRSRVAARRLVWSLLHLRRPAEAQVAAVRLVAMGESDDGISEWLIEATGQAVALASSDGELGRPEPGGDAERGGEQEPVENVLIVVEGAMDRAAALLTGLPIFTYSQARQALAGIREPDARLPTR